jgi:hypothetical protein
MDAKELMESDLSSNSEVTRALKLLLEVFIAGEEWGIRQMIRANLISAKENDAFKIGGYLHHATPAEIADDMIALVDSVMEIPAELLIPPITEWLKENNLNVRDKPQA